MPLIWGNVTVASRIMLPTYVALTAVIGGVYLLDPGDRLNSVHALSAQRILMPMQVWGLMFLVVCAVMVSALLTHRRFWFVFALYLCGATFLMWSALYAWSVFLDPQTSVLAPVYPVFVVVACRASAKSLLRGEV